MHSLARAFVAATLLLIAYLIAQEHKPQPTLPLTEADWTQCVSIKNAPMKPTKRKIRNGSHGSDIA